MFRFPVLCTLACAFRGQAAPPTSPRRSDFSKPGGSASTPMRLAYSRAFRITFLLLAGLAIPGLAQTAIPAATFLSFNAAQIGESGGSAQTLTASFAISGFPGNFTPTTALHYGHDYTLGSVSCSGGSPETCTVPVTFQPTLPGTRKDAIFLMNGSTRLATVLLNGVGQGPMSLLQPGAFTTSIPSSNLSTSYYIYQSVTDENGTVYLLPSGGYPFVFSVTKAGVVTQLPLTSPPYFWTIGIDGAGLLYLFGESKTVTTYDTVQGIQGTYVIPYAGNDTSWYPGTVDGQGNFYIVDQIANNGEIYEFNANRTSAYQDILSPRVLQPFTIAVDSQGNAFVGGYEIDEVSPAGVSSQVNTVGASEGLAVDAADTLYATRYIPLNEPSQGVAMLPASNYSTPEASIDGNQSPLGVSVGSDGTVFVSNYNNLDVFNRAISQTLPSIDFGGVTAGQTSSPMAGQIYNGGNETLTINSLALTGSAFTLQAAVANSCTAGMQLSPGALCQLSLTFSPPGPGTFIGTIAVATNSLNSNSTVQNLVVKGESSGINISASPATLAFGSQNTGTTSTTMTETMTNTGYGYSVTIGTPSSSNVAFSVTQGTCTASLAVGASCQLFLTFSPSSGEGYNGTISVPYSATGGGPGVPATFAVTGTGTGPAPTATLAPAGPLAFGNQTANTTSTAQSLTLSNSGSAALSISSIAFAGANPADFSEINNCPASLAQGANCTIQVSFTPASAASFGASIAVTDNAPGSPQSVALTGTGTAAPAPVASLTPATLSFTASTGTTSPAQTATLTNTGNAALTITGFAINGANASNFAQTNNCGASLAAGASCNISITFAPTSVASSSAALAVTDNASGSPHTVALSGSGTAAPAPVAVLTPASLSFGSVGIGGTSAAHAATLKNTGNEALSINSIAIAGANLADFAQTNTCGASLAAGASCSINVTFTPASVASFSATVTVTDNATGSPHQVALTGTGIVEPPVFTIAPTSVAFGNQVVNTTSASQTVTLTNTSATDTVTISNSTSSDPAFVDAADTCHASIAPGGTCHFLMVFNPKAVQAYGATVTLQIAGVSCVTCTYPSQTFAVTGTGTSAITISPASLSFGNQIVNTTSAKQGVTFTDLLSDTVHVVSAVSSDPAFVSDLTNSGCQSAWGGSCVLHVSFTPSATQSYSATFTVQLSDLNNPGVALPAQTFTVTGTGISAPPAATISPASLSFGNQIVNTTSAKQGVTFTDLLSDTVKVVSAVSSDPAFVSDLTNSGCLSAWGGVGGGYCVLHVSFSPSAVQPYSATFTVQFADLTNPGVTFPTQTFAVSGTGIAQPPVFAISPASLAFANQAVGTTSAPQFVTLTNTSKTDTLTLSTLDGSSSDFPVPVACQTQIAPGASCTISALFRPAAPKAYSGVMHIEAESITCPACTFPAQTVSLTGTGVAPVITLSPTSLTFSGTQGDPIAAQTVSVTNTGNEALGFSGIAVVGANASLFNQTNNCPSSLATSASCTVSVSFVAQTAGVFNANLNFLGAGPSGASASASMTLSGTLFSQGPVMTVTPATMDFGNQPVGIAGTQSVTLTNTSKSDSVFLFSDASSGSTFTIGNGNCGNPIPSGESCSLPVSFDPTAPQPYAANITFQMKSTTCPACNYPAQSFSVTGTGVASVITLAPSSLTFTTVAGTASVAQTATLTNTGNGPLAMTPAFVGGPNPSSFNVTNNCPSTLAAGVSCTFTATFVPQTAGAFGAIVDIGGIGPGNVSVTGNLTLTGNATPQIAAGFFTPGSLTFSSIALVNSAPLTATLTNTGNEPITVLNIQIFGTNPNQFTQTNNCTQPIPVGASCTFSITFSPSAAGTFSEQLVAALRTPNGSADNAFLFFSGTAQPNITTGTLSTTSLNFSTTAGTTSAAQTATLTNTGNLTLMIGSISLGGNFPNDYKESDNCGLQVAVGASCAISVTFAPTALGSYPATVTINDNDPTSPETISLMGNSVNIPDFVVASSIPSLAVPPGGSAQVAITVSAQNGATIPAVSLAATGLPPGATASFTQSAITPGSTSATTTLTIQTAPIVATNRKSGLPLSGLSRSSASLPALALLSWFVVPRKARRRWLTLGLLLLVSLGAIPALSGCSGGFNLIPPPKIYTVTITGTIGTVQQTTTVQLTVE